MVILTTFMAPPFLRVAFKGQEQLEAEPADSTAEAVAESVESEPVDLASN
jgi:hypothetical protein